MAFSFIALIAMLALAVPRWPDVVAEYHALRLRSDPALLAEAIEAPGSPGRERGLDRFLRRDEGRRALLDLFIQRFLEDRRSFQDDLAGSSGLQVALGADWLQLLRWNAAGVMSGSVSSIVRDPYRLDPVSSASRRWAGIAARLGTLEGAEIRSPSHPAWTFTVHPRANGAGQEPRTLFLTARRT